MRHGRATSTSLPSLLFGAKRPEDGRRVSDVVLPLPRAIWLTAIDQSGSVPSSGWHLVYLNLGIDAPYPLSCHLGFDNQTHIALSTPNGTSGTFNLTNAADSDPQTFGLSTSMAATSATATSTSTGAAAAVTTVVVNSTDSTSGGTIAGIVIAVVFGVAIVLGALIFLCLRKRRIDRRRRGATTGTASEDTETRAPDAQGFFAGEMAADHKYQSELPAEPKPVVEKDGMPQPAELPTEQVSEGPLEMEGSNTFLGRLRGMSLKN